MNIKAKVKNSIKSILRKSAKLDKSLIMNKSSSSSSSSSSVGSSSSSKTINSNKNNTNYQNSDQPSFIKTSINLLHRFLVLCFRIIIKKWYGEKGPSMPPIKNLILLESATSLAHKIRTRKLTSVDVLESFISRIAEINQNVNCVVDKRYEEALKEAKQVDDLIASGKYTVEELEKTKPFLGVPISTKDCIMVKGMLHTAGLYRRRTIRGAEDSDAIRLMRDAGAIPFALTNVSECCMWWESSNPVHGRTKNPYDNNRIVGGSSGGEGCLQAAAGSPFGLGSDIGGSIRMPAFFNGIFGHKPSKFIVSNKGQYPIPFSEEVTSYLGLGPMCRFATDMKPMLKIIAGSKNSEILKLDEPVNVSNIKYFYQENDGGGHLISPVDHDIRIGMEKVIKHLQTALKVKPKQMKLGRLKKSTILWLANMKEKPPVPGFDSQLLNLEGRINPYWELFKWIFGFSHHTFIAIMTALTEVTGVKYGSPKHTHLVNERNALLKEIQDVLGDDGVLLYPTHPTVAPYHNEPILRALNFSYTGIINVLGLPATAVPLGLGREGLPIGLQVVANINQDRLCLAVACELERAFGGWVAPSVDI